MKYVIYFLKQIHMYAGKSLYINLIAMTVVGLLESVGILLLVPLISITGIVNVETEGIAILSIFSFLKDIPVNIALPLILAIYVLIVIGQNLFQRQITIRNTAIQQGFLRQMRVDTYDDLLYSNWDFFIKNRKTDLINVLTTEIARSSGGAYSFLQFAASLIFTLIQIGIAFLLSPSITSFVLVCGIVLLFLNRKFLKRSIELGDRNYELGRKYLAGITDQINGIKDIKSNTLEESRMDWYRTITEKMKKEQVDYTRLRTTSQFYYKAASAIFIAAFIFVAISLFQAQTGHLMLVIVIFSRLWPRVAGIQGSMEQLVKTIPSFKAVKTMQHQCKQALEFEKHHRQQVKPLQLNKGIECSHVFFRYNKQHPSYALKDINLVIPTNQMTAVVGRSGAGKSTLIDLLMGLNEPEKGYVLIDGKPLTHDKLGSLRNAISYVPQDPFLFNESIRENLLLVKPDASEEELWSALRFSSASEFVEKLSEGLDAVIGDRGIKLSGGERQRLVLARAILRNPSILVLDEATSALDTDNEAKIQQALERLKGRMTIIVIAHRLSTIRNADQVVVLEGGQVVQKGGFSQLANEKRSLFSNLLQNQFEVVSE